MHHLQALQPVRQSSAPDMRRDATAPAADLTWPVPSVSFSSHAIEPTTSYWNHDVGPFDALMGAGRSRRSMAQRQAELQRISQLSTLGEDPERWLKRKQTAETPTALYSLAALRPSYLSAAGPSAPQTSPSLTSADTHPSASRVTSREESLRHGIQMIRVDSQAESLVSLPSDVYHLTRDGYDLGPVLPRHEESTQLVMGAGGASSPSTTLPLFSLPGSSPSTIVHQGGERMELSFSNESSASNSSSKSRNKQRLEVSIQTAARQLLPRQALDDHAMSREASSQSMQRQASHAGDDAWKRASKRPKHPQVYCTQCDDHPAFRGDHELQRHCKREHRHKVQHWICVEPARLSLQHPRPKRPLSDCQACMEKKRYNAYYNAAVHLRKIHFNPVSRGRSRPLGSLAHDTSPATDGEQWPKMPELKKHWMRSVWESKPRTAPVRQGADPGDESDVDDGGVLIDTDPARDAPLPESLTVDPMCWAMSPSVDGTPSTQRVSQVESEFEQGMMVYDDVDVDIDLDADADLDDLTLGAFDLAQDAELAALYDFAMPSTMSSS